MVITAEEGFSVVWDGNEGDNFSADEPAPVPPNLANAAGATAFASSELGPELSLPFHLAVNLNDSLYGNANSWIGGNKPGTPYAAISLGGLTTLTSFAFGRDNGNNVSDPQANNYFGQLPDRCMGTYIVQITRVSFPDAAITDTGDAATGWQTIGTLNYNSNDDTVLGESFTAYYRHEFEIAQGTSGIQATGFRLLVPGTGSGGNGTAIDEIELYGPAVVSPDKDGDGFDDTVETALGFDPNNAASTPESRNDLLLAVQFDFYGAKSKKYKIEGSADMSTWVTEETDIPGRGEKITRFYSKSGDRRYFRAVRLDP